MTATERTLKLPITHVQDWISRGLAEDTGCEVSPVAHTARTITLTFNRHAIEELIADAVYYAEEMGPGNTGDVDYRPRARALLRALGTAGVCWTRRGFSIAVTSW